ncbi:MAG: class I SAM-dependent methyltransferase [Acidobacteriota bacterium]
MAWVYRPYRSRIAEALSLSPGDTVIDLACGTGENFEELVSRVGDDGKVLAIDASRGMLSRARSRCEKHGWTNVRLIEKDARFALREDFFEGDADRKAQAVVCTLGLSTIPSWQEVLASALSWVEPGGRIVLFDVYADRWVPQQAVVSLLAQADLKRQSWLALEAITGDCEFRFLEGSRHLHGGRPFLARGSRSLGWDTSEVRTAVAAAQEAARGERLGRPTPPETA